MRLSIVIPSYKEPYLQKMINDILDNSELENNLEVVVVLDSYWPDLETIVNDPRVRYLHLGKNSGMRRAINAGVSVARGRFIMRADAHCCFGKGFDRILTNTCQPNWIVTAMRYFLDPISWKVMDIPPVGYEKLVIQGGIKFSGQKWRSRDVERLCREVCG